MVMSIEEQLDMLEQKKSKIKGPGSKDKKAEIQQQIDDLKNSVKDEPEEKKESSRPETPDDGTISDEDMIVKDTRPIPKNWVKVTMEQVQEAEKSGKLYGFDPKKMIALLR